MEYNKSCEEVMRNSDMLRLCCECVRQDIYEPLSQWLWPWEFWGDTHRKRIYNKGRTCKNKKKYMIKINTIYLIFF